MFLSSDGRRQLNALLQAAANRRLQEGFASGNPKRNTVFRSASPLWVSNVRCGTPSKFVLATSQQSTGNTSPTRFLHTHAMYLTEFKPVKKKRWQESFLGVWTSLHVIYHGAHVSRTQRKPDELCWFTLRYKQITATIFSLSVPLWNSGWKRSTYQCFVDQVSNFEANMLFWLIQAGSR